jgi:hypothetical protein
MKRCARCGKPLPAERPRLFSTHTRSYYCTDIDACARRTLRIRSKR